MADNQYATLLRGLKAGSDNGKVNWQEIPDEEMFRAHVGGGMVRIGRTDHDDRKAFTL